MAIKSASAPAMIGSAASGQARPVRSPTPGAAARAERWVGPLGWVALAVWLAIPFLGVFEQPLAGRVVWTMAVAGLPLFIVVVGYHRWRRICPLAFFNQIPVKLRRPGTRRASARFEEHYYFVPFTMFLLGLWLRLIWTNGDGTAIAIFFVGISLLALVAGVIFTGKTWCNYICPVSFIEKIYTEPHGLRETQNSQCSKCTACKKACPDINQENGYWKEIESPSKRFVYFAYPGLVLAFYFYYFLQSGTWDYYFGGSWTDQPGVILRAFLPGTDAESAGFFFAPGVPRAAAALLTLASFAVLSFGVFALVERAVGPWLRRRNPKVDAAQVRNVMFGLAAFTAFVTFYSFAGQPTLRKVPWLPAYTSVAVVLTAALFLVRRLTRTQQDFAEQSLARNIIKRWTWPDTPPPASLHDAYVVHTARTTERQRMYAEVLEVYQDAIREVLADGFVTRAEVQRLEALRDQLQITKADHERIMATLAEEERLLLTDPSKQTSAEKRLQLDTYARALERDIERVLAAERGADDGIVQQLRAEFAVTPEEHALVLDQLLGSDKHTGTQIAGAVRLIQLSMHMIGVLASQASTTNDALIAFLRRERARAVERLLRAFHFAPDDPITRSVRTGLCSDDLVLFRAALEELGSQVRPNVRDHLAKALDDATHEAQLLVGEADIYNACLNDADPFVRAVALYGLAEHGRIDAEVLERSSEDAYPLVRETALALAGWQAEAADVRMRRPPMFTIEKLLALRSVPLFAPLGPDALERLARAAEEREFAPGSALCIAGETGNEVFVLLTGRVAVLRGSQSDGELIRTEGVGSVIGEMAVLDTAPRSVSVIADPPGARALSLAGSAFRGVLEGDPAVAEGVIRTLAQRLREKDKEEVLAPA